MRPEHLELVAPGSGRLAGKVSFLEALGAESLAHIDLGSGERVIARCDSAATAEIGEAVDLNWRSDAFVEFDTSGRAIKTP